MNGPVYKYFIIDGTVMLLNEILLELANTSYPFKLVWRSEKDTLPEWRYEFTAEKSKIPVQYKSEFQLRPEGNILIVNFRAREADKETLKLGNYWKDDITNTGDAFKVFSTVVATIKDCLKRIDNDDLTVDIIEFAADTDDQSRIKLYTRFADNIGKYLPGWKLKTAKNGAKYLNFRFTK